MREIPLKEMDVVQLAPEVKNPAFAGCFMVITEPKSWGAQGFVQCPGQGQAYYRATWAEMEYIGRAAFVLSDHAAPPAAKEDVRE